MARRRRFVNDEGNPFQGQQATLITINTVRDESTLTLQFRLKPIPCDDPSKVPPTTH